MITFLAWLYREEWMKRGHKDNAETWNNFRTWLNKMSMFDMLSKFEEYQVQESMTTTRSNRG